MAVEVEKLGSKESRGKAEQEQNCTRRLTTWRHWGHAFLGADDHALVTIVDYKSSAAKRKSPNIASASSAQHASIISSFVAYTWNRDDLNKDGPGVSPNGQTIDHR